MVFQIHITMRVNVVERGSIVVERVHVKLDAHGQQVLCYSVFSGLGLV